MMTSARPMAMRRSRVQTRMSCRKECAVFERSAAAPENSGPTAPREGDPGVGFSGTSMGGGDFSSVFSIFLLHRIYNTFATAGARFAFPQQRSFGATFLPPFYRIPAGCLKLLCARQRKTLADCR